MRVRQMRDAIEKPAYAKGRAVRGDGSHKSGLGGHVREARRYKWTSNGHESSKDPTPPVKPMETIDEESVGYGGGGDIGEAVINKGVDGHVDAGGEGGKGEKGRGAEVKRLKENGEGEVKEEEPF